MTTAAPEVEMQMQVLFGLHGLLAKYEEARQEYLKMTHEEEEAPEFLFSVEDVALGIVKVNVQETVRFKEPNSGHAPINQQSATANQRKHFRLQNKALMSNVESSPAHVPINQQTATANQQRPFRLKNKALMHIPICGQKAIINQPTEVTDDCTPMHAQQLRIALSQFGTQPHDIAQIDELMPRCTLNDMHMPYKNSSSACRAFADITSSDIFEDI
eukprot:gnl/MRDRNA2_/MRDRNA2_85345_c0_seq1.p1 gnl/MRDRNA2_/MRDRNA2_85345_c0~~gnl/MRDRNA2_/MRDRNA2_85345_c0_seq1.p1  ORF type:complete len:216 (+),score=51.55 gnl/MRDRNA2_/MRDRNA2_85345_c0_seq1:90-737(+)